MKKNEKIKSSLILLLTACIWGVAFVAQSVGMDYSGPVTFNGARFLLGGIVLLPVIWFRSRSDKKNGTAESDSAVKRNNQKMTWIGGTCCGLALCAASLFQQYGIQRTTVGKAGFITTLYIILVPLFGIFLGKKVRPVIGAGAAMAAAGLYLLCMNESVSFGTGDMLVLVCAVIFSVHILLIDYFSPKADGVKISCIQFFVSGVICLIGAFLFEEPSLPALLAGWVPLLYTGVLSCGIAYTLQIIGQKHLDPTVASLILSLESVISVLAGWLILGQTLNLRETAGCAVVFCAVILVQLPQKNKKSEKLCLDSQNQ